MSITVSEKQFKNSAKRLKSLLEEKNNSFSYNQCLQLLSQSLTSKPFEEVKSTLFNEENNQDIGSVVIFSYGSESILTSNGEYIKQLCVGSDDEITYNELYEIAELLANEKRTHIREFELPEILDNEWQIDDVIHLADILGYFKYKTPLIEIIEEANNILIEVNGLKFLAPNNLNGDWYDTIEDTENFKDVVWFLEYQDQDFNFSEFYLTLQNIGNAKKISNTNIDDSQWQLSDDFNNVFTITLL
tara:strand:- start:14265 stop:14999 length:735 start_codon:yes stop_codon:yes gene_type:complete